MGICFAFLVAYIPTASNIHTSLCPSVSDGLQHVGCCSVFILKWPELLISSPHLLLVPVWYGVTLPWPPEELCEGQLLQLTDVRQSCHDRLQRNEHNLSHIQKYTSTLNASNDSHAHYKPLCTRKSWPLWLHPVPCANIYCAALWWKIPLVFS